jgi:hypothetical protein
MVGFGGHLFNSTRLFTGPPLSGYFTGNPALHGKSTVQYSAIITVYIILHCVVQVVQGGRLLNTVLQVLPRIYCTGTVGLWPGKYCSCRGGKYCIIL